MTAHPWHDVPLSENPTDWFPAYIEVPRGTKVKYELDKATGLLRVDRILYSAVHYPAHYGFVPRTYCEDNDPIDVLVLCREEVAPGILLRARAIGVMPLYDEKGRDDKLIAVHVDDPDYREYTSIDQLPPHRMTELRRFFLDYKVLEGKRVEVEIPHGPGPAIDILLEAIALYARERDRLRQPLD